jgi:hypothetical protein
LFVLFCGAARRKKKEKNKKRIFLFVNSTRCNFRAVNAEEPEHHGQVLKEEEENKFKRDEFFDETFTHAGTQTNRPQFFHHSTYRFDWTLIICKKRETLVSSFFSNSTGKSNHQPDRKFNGNSSRRFTYTGACYVLGKF